jgi:hypothetical protein
MPPEVAPGEPVELTETRPGVGWPPRFERTPPVPNVPPGRFVSPFPAGMPPEVAPGEPVELTETRPGVGGPPRFERTPPVPNVPRPLKDRK